MQRMEWRNGKLQPVDCKAFSMRIISAHMQGMTPSEFAEQELQLMDKRRLWMACKKCGSMDMKYQSIPIFGDLNLGTTSEWLECNNCGAKHDLSGELRQSSLSKFYESEREKE